MFEFINKILSTRRFDFYYFLIYVFLSEKLQEIKETENSEDVFTKPPTPHYKEVASMLLRW